jgi:hypothetical protein
MGQPKGAEPAEADVIAQLQASVSGSERDRRAYASLRDANPHKDKREVMFAKVFVLGIETGRTPLDCIFPERFQANNEIHPGARELRSLSD